MTPAQHAWLEEMERFRSADPCRCNDCLGNPIIAERIDPHGGQYELIEHMRSWLEEQGGVLKPGDIVSVDLAPVTAMDEIATHASELLRNIIGTQIIPDKRDRETVIMRLGQILQLTGKWGEVYEDEYSPQYTAYEVKLNSLSTEMRDKWIDGDWDCGCPECEDGR